MVDRYHTCGSAVAAGRLEGPRHGVPAKAGKPKNRTTDEDRDPQALPPGLAKGQPQDVVDVEALKKKTRPPKRFTEGTLLTAMETAGKTLDEKELSDAMKETGLGTPATRAAIIEVLLKREYIVRNGKSLEATDKGIRLIEVVHPEVKSPAMTGQWEAYLRGSSAAAQLDALHEGHRGLRARGGRQDVGRGPSAATGHGSAGAGGASDPSRLVRQPEARCQHRLRRGTERTRSPSCCASEFSASPPSAPTRKPSARR